MKKIQRENGMESSAEAIVEIKIQYLVLEKYWTNFCLVWKDQWDYFWWSVWCPRLDLALNWKQCLVNYHQTLVNFLEKISSPLEAIPKIRHSKTYIIPKYEELKVHFETLMGIDVDVICLNLVLIHCCLKYIFIMLKYFVLLKHFLTIS